MTGNEQNIYLEEELPLATKGYWGMKVLLSLFALLGIYGGFVIGLPLFQDEGSTQAFATMFMVCVVFYSVISLFSITQIWGMRSNACAIYFTAQGLQLLTGIAAAVVRYTPCIAIIITALLSSFILFLLLRLKPGQTLSLRRRGGLIVVLLSAMLGNNNGRDVFGRQRLTQPYAMLLVTGVLLCLVTGWIGVRSGMNLNPPYVSNFETVGDSTWTMTEQEIVNAALQSDTTFQNILLGK